jgi:pyruvate/2-oxoglutarate dehydrogenase complex dihydrolipoamide dehydrogenase (E3) component
VAGGSRFLAFGAKMVIFHPDIEGRKILPCIFSRPEAKLVLNIVGLGYIGLPTALMFAKSGVKVVGTDCNKALVESLTAGKLTFQEDGLEQLFRDALKMGAAC